MKIGDNIVSEFDEFSVNYTEDMTNCVPYYKKLLSSFTTSIPEAFNPNRILDLGCGNGNVSAMVMQSFPNATYELLDASPQMLDLCKTRFKDFKTIFHTSFFNDFNFEENKYDMITAGFSIHHCVGDEKKDLFKKIYRSLKSSGIFGMCDLMINKNRPEHKDLLADWKKFVLKNYPNEEKWQWLMEHYNEFDNPESLALQTNWLKEAGFTQIEPLINEDYWVYLRAIKN